VLQVRGVSHAFAERPVLDDVTFDVPPGVLMGLLGPNGAGKTTLMRIMFGVIDPDAGQTWWQGHEVTTTDRRRWGYMPQERGLYPAMPAGDQLVYLARLHGVGRGAATTYASLDPTEKTVALLFVQHFPGDEHGILWRFSTLFYQAIAD
jgi:ABC-2 type transport system ATP-binding protein